MDDMAGSEKGGRSQLMNQSTSQQQRIPAIPLQMTYLRDESAGARFLAEPVSLTGELDIAALCVFLSTGMFLGCDTYFKDLKTVRAGEDMALDPSGLLLSRTQRFNWSVGTESDEFQYRDACVDKLD